MKTALYKTLAFTIICFVHVLHSEVIHTPITAADYAEQIGFGFDVSWSKSNQISNIFS